MSSIKKTNRGGARPGAGRPKKLQGVRKQHQLRAYDDEWELIREFSWFVKHGCKEDCAKIMAQLRKIRGRKKHSVDAHLIFVHGLLRTKISGRMTM